MPEDHCFSSSLLPQHAHRVAACQKRATGSTANKSAGPTVQRSEGHGHSAASGLPKEGLAGQVHPAGIRETSTCFEFLHFCVPS